MWNRIKNTFKLQDDESKIKSMNILHIVLVIFIVSWILGGAYYLASSDAILILDPVPKLIGDKDSSNDINDFISLPHNLLSNSAPINISTNEVSKPKFKIKDSYKFGDIVVIRFFYTVGVIIDKSIPTGDSYVVLYRDENNVLEKINLPKDMLLSPPAGMVNPLSLIGK